MKKVLVVFGTRPEAIKMAPIVKELYKHPDNFKTIVCVTAQHRQMLDQVLDIFGIVPDLDLNIMQPGQDLTDITVKVLAGIRDIISKVEPDIVLVHGDTTTSSSTALAAYYHHVPVAHIEAGLRTHDIYSPWPEEINRQITGRIARWHFAPTELNKQNLLNEGVPPENIFVTGNTVIDAINIALGKINKCEEVGGRIEHELIISGLRTDLLHNWNANEGKRRMVLITGHRRENFGEGFINICKAIRDLARSNSDVDFVYPVHMNPNVRKPVHEILKLNTGVSSNIFLIEPLQYLPFVYLMKMSFLVLTDSGGIQEEAPGFGKPVLVMRNTTERPEGVSSGIVRLIGTDHHTIIKEVNILLNHKESYREMSLAKNPYGDGHSSAMIVTILKSIILA